MGSYSKRAVRCPRCRLHLPLCICAAIPRLELATRLVLVMHHREQVKPTATGPLALAALPNSELRSHGRPDHPLDCRDLVVPGRRLFCLFPGDDVPVLSRELLDGDDRPVTLVVPDGTWGQAVRMTRRIPGLERATVVRLPPGPPTAWGIRREHHPDGLATFEAIARALGIMESPAVQADLEELFGLMVRRTIQARFGHAPATEEDHADSA